MPYRANYTSVSFQELLADDEDALDVPWAEFVGDRSSIHEFTVRTADARDPYIELQAYDVSEFGHDIRINGDSLSGFDIPPADGWQYWMDTITDVELFEGSNTIQIIRDAAEDDAFVVGTVIVHWREPTRTITAEEES